MDYNLTKQQIALKKEFEHFFQEEMKKAPPEYWQSGQFETVYISDAGWEFYKYMKGRYAEKGWAALAWPMEYGGAGLTLMEQLLFDEAQSLYGAPRDIYGIRMFGQAVLVFATEEQRKRILPPIVSGEIQYCQGWSEPNAGSDLAALTTTAVRDGNDYVVNGQKTWTSGAHRSDKIFLLARTDPNSSRGEGLSVFNVDLGLPGIEIRPVHFMNGDHVFNEVYFTDVRVPASELIGGEENDGWRQTRATMNFERSLIAFFAGTRRRLDEFIEYVKTTKRDGRFLAENPIIRHKIAQLHVDIEVGRSLAYSTAFAELSGNMLFSAAAASESRVFGGELYQRVANVTTEIMGLYGQVESSRWAPLNGIASDGYQFNIGFNIGGGTSEIQRNIIAWIGLGMPRLKTVKTK
ncbi:Acyl-CoA dehydrogenase domain protein [Desulfatibacillum aliphaticivorans]|uniref:Acyl-CoA dehydrogenase domain protein n=1 Tax=Desulfatibacillum aliphaticivorans TaxID=218208 RepID=B8FMY6_DESAL|nr:acyl-CoA dehydrogenase family protein [Desulfatibacillum aliphaticivorans]ACL05856.1 Acyl-CoA dehydrogenase domain protein [Desulfatibacillum aliphaticivorans]